MLSKRGFDGASWCTQLLEGLKPFQVEAPASLLDTVEHNFRKIRVQRSFRYFLEHFVHVADGGGAKLQPWPWQRDVAKRLQRFQRVLVLKGRQLGLSWIAAAYALWVALTNRGALVLLLSQTKDDALELLAKVQFIFDKLPEWLKPAGTLSRTQLLKFPGLHSAIVALPSTKRAGRGRTARLVIADEHATHTWATDNFAATSPTIDAGGQFLSISTANGLGNLYADLCAQASAETGWVTPALRPDGHYGFGNRLRDVKLPEDGWLPLFIPYCARPGRDAQWWERKRRSYPREWMVHQEYPRDPEEAFVQTGRPVFLKEYVDRHRARCCDPLPVHQWPTTHDREGTPLFPFGGWDSRELRVWAPPVQRHRHVAGADVAEGLEHGDYSDLAVFDVDAGPRPVEVLSLHGHWDPDVFARMIHAVALMYPGVYGIERNNHGHTVVITCRNLGTPGLFRERAVLNNQGQEIEPGKLGWLTSAVTKPLAIDDLARCLRDDQMELRDALAIPELIAYQTNADGSTSAPSGKHDDRVMSRAIAMQMVKHLPPPIELPSEDDFGSVGPFAARNW